MADVLGAKKGQIGPDGQLHLADNAADMMTQQMLNVGQLSQHNSVFDDWMYPEQKEARQNLQQMILDRASYANKMEGMKEAGINPLTAAAGLAGSSAQMPEPSSSVDPIGDVAGAASSALGAMSDVPLKAAQAKAQEAAAGLDVANTGNVDRLADAEVFFKASQAAQALTKCGIPDIQAMALGLGYARDGMKGFASAFNTDHYCRMYDLEMDQIDAAINAENARFEQSQALTRLYASETQLANEKAMHENILMQYDNKKLEVSKKYEAMFADGEGMQQFILAQTYGSDSPEYQGYMNFVKDKFYNQSAGSFQADIDSAWERFKNKTEGEDFGRLIHGKELANLENFKTMFEVMSELYFGSGSTETALLSRLINVTAVMFGLNQDELSKMFHDALNP